MYMWILVHTHLYKTCFPENLVDSLNLRFEIFLQFQGLFFSYQLKKTPPFLLSFPSSGAPLRWMLILTLLNLFSLALNFYFTVSICSPPCVHITWGPTNSVFLCVQLAIYQILVFNKLFKKKKSPSFLPVLFHQYLPISII